MDKPWKAQEREVAALLGTQRERFGKARQGEADVRHALLFVEVKHRKRATFEDMAGWLAKAEQAAPPEKVAVVVVKKRRGQGRPGMRLWVFSDQGIQGLFRSSVAPIRPTGPHGAESDAAGSSRSSRPVSPHTSSSGPGSRSGFRPRPPRPQGRERPSPRSAGSQSVLHEPKGNPETSTQASVARGRSVTASGGRHPMTRPWPFPSCGQTPRPSSRPRTRLSRSGDGQR